MSVKDSITLLIKLSSHYESFSVVEKLLSHEFDSCCR